MRESRREERVLERGLFEYFGSLALAAASKFIFETSEAIGNQNVD
jgi:hypothetical protein